MELCYRRTFIDVAEKPKKKRGSKSCPPAKLDSEDCCCVSKKSLARRSEMDTLSCFRQDEVLLDSQVKSLLRRAKDGIAFYNEQGF